MNMLLRRLADAPDETDWLAISDARRDVHGRIEEDRFVVRLMDPASTDYRSRHSSAESLSSLTGRLPI